MNWLSNDRGHRGQIQLLCALAALAALVTLVVPALSAGHVALPVLTAAAMQATPAAADTQESADGVQIAARVLVPAPPGAETIYAVGGLSRSSDGGQTWETAGPPPPPGRVVAAGDDPLLLLAGARPPCGRAELNPLPLQRSTDGGMTWAPVRGGAGIGPLAVWSEPQLALGASCLGLHVSLDAGLTWPETRSPNPALMESGYTVSALAPIAGTDPATRSALVLGTSEGGTSQLRRLDLSNPAQPTASDTLLSFWGPASLAGQMTDEGEFYVVGTANGVWVSADGGATWNQSRQGLEDVTLSVDPTQGPIPDEERQRGFGITAVAIDPNQSQRLMAGTVNGLFISTDGGVTWERSPAVDGPIGGLALAADSGTLVVQTSAGVTTVPMGT